MEIRPHRIIKRKITKRIKVGNVQVGGDSIISVQSDEHFNHRYKGTVNQITPLKKLADIVRVSCPDQDSTKALKEIVKRLSSNRG